MKINWFSPLPPEETPLAAACLRTVQSLARFADVRVWTSQAETADSVAAACNSIRRFDPYGVDFFELQQAEVTIYNIGRGPGFQQSIWEVSRSHAGIVVLHDLYLREHFMPIADFQGIHHMSSPQLMSAYYGNDGYFFATACARGCAAPADAGTRYPLFEPAVDNALAVVVHDEAAFAEVSARRCWPVVLARPDVSFESYAGAIVDFARQFREFRVQYIARKLAHRAGEAASPWLHPQLGCTTVDQIALRIRDMFPQP